MYHISDQLYLLLFCVFFFFNHSHSSPPYLSVTSHPHHSTPQCSVIRVLSLLLLKLHSVTRSIFPPLVRINISKYTGSEQILADRS